MNAEFLGENNAVTSAMAVTVKISILPIQCSKIYHYARGRGSKYIKDILAGFKGYLQVDGYAGYDWVEHPSSGIIRVGCLAHVRREFTDFLKAIASKKARSELAIMKRLYAIEAKLREDPSLDRKVIRPEETVRRWEVTYRSRIWVLTST